MKKVILLSSLLALSSAFAQNVSITIGGYDGPTDTATQVMLTFSTATPR